MNETAWRCFSAEEVWIRSAYTCCLLKLGHKVVIISKNRALSAEVRNGSRVHSDKCSCCKDPLSLQGGGTGSQFVLK